MKIQKIYTFEKFKELLSDSRFIASCEFLHGKENVIGKMGDTLYVFEEDELAQIMHEKLKRIEEKNENNNRMETDNK
jgi:hypothetical protein